MFHSACLPSLFDLSHLALSSITSSSSPSSSQRQESGVHHALTLSPSVLRFHHRVDKGVQREREIFELYQHPLSWTRDRDMKKFNEWYQTTSRSRYANIISTRRVRWRAVRMVWCFIRLTRLYSSRQCLSTSILQRFTPSDNCHSSLRTKGEDVFQLTHCDDCWSNERRFDDVRHSLPVVSPSLIRFRCSRRIVHRWSIDELPLLDPLINASVWQVDACAMWPFLSLKLSIINLCKRIILSEIEAERRR